MNTSKRTPWTAADIPDQSGRRYIVTGANSGLGFETTKALAARGAWVVMACRSEERAEAARDELPDEARANTEFRPLDVGDLESVRAFADAASGETFDVLINNAGVMNIPFGRTPQGFERQFGVNVLGHFALSRLLDDRITERFVWLGSQMHRFGTIALDDLNWERRKYSPVGAYGQTKLACVMLAYEQQRRFVRDGDLRRSVVAHPGYSATNLQTRSESKIVDRIMALGNGISLLAQTSEMGALPTLYAATVPDLPGATYIGPDGPFELRGHPRPVSSTGASYDTDVARGLWEACEELTGT